MPRPVNGGLMVVALVAAGVMPRVARAGGMLDDDRGWSAGTIQQQLDRDPTLVPFGKGAIFVPSMTNPLDEPPVTVYRGGQRVDEGTTGLRILVAPGTYEVRLGSGPLEHRISIQATVRERHTTVIPVSWAGLSIHVLDEQFSSLRGSYEIIRVDDREYIGSGFGTDEQAGEPLSTWVLPPGLYKIVRLGENYRARTDFTTVRLQPGQHTHFILVQDATGEFKGAGEVPEEEVFRPTDDFFGSVVLGADAALNSRRNAIGIEDGETITFRLFLDSRLSIRAFDNPLVLRLQVEEGQTKAVGVPWQKSNDRVDLDALYVYRFTPVIGPYARVGAETGLLPGFDFIEPSRVERQFDDGRVELTGREVSEVKISRAFGLVSLREGAGINVRALKTLLAEFNVRVGAGGRHRFTRALFEPLGPQLRTVDLGGVPTEISAQVYRETESSQLFGAEATLIGFARLTRWVFINLEADLFLPTRGFDATIVEVEGSAALKLTSYLSLNYIGRFARDPSLSEGNRITQDLVLRFSWEIL